jgi:phage regulator Rha-like protein
MDKIIVIHKSEPRVSSWIVKDGYEIEHRAIRRLVKKYQSEFKELGFIATGLQQIKRGRPVKTYLLNEEQTYFLGTLLPNTDVVRRFKLTLVKNFSIAKKALMQRDIQKQDPAHIAQREAGKIVHREKTDIIKDFVSYAINQGGSIKGCEMYYSNFAKMENKALFILEQKFKNLRDILNLNQLATITSADGIAKKAIREGMKDGLHYKDIYQLAKGRVETFATLHGRTFIPTTQLRIEA